MQRNLDLSDIQGVQPKAWRNAHPEDRIISLREVENRLAQTQGRDPKVVMPREYNNDIKNGHYDPSDSNYIYINNQFLLRDSPVSAVHAVAHEGRHVYQHDCSDHPDRHPEANDVQVNEWRHNLKPENYKQPEQSYKAYKAQPVEKDADDYADSVVRETYKDREQAKDPGSSTGKTNKRDNLLKGWGKKPEPQNRDAEAEYER